jgi:hypothetical protein
MAFLQPQTGLFSANPNTVINQDFFDAAFAGRLAADPIYKEAYNCNLIGQCNMSTWIEEYMGYESDCNPAYSLIERSSYNEQVKVKTAVTVAAYPAITAVAIAAANHYVGGVYVLPQVGNGIVFPDGTLATVKAINVTTANNTTMGLQLRDPAATAKALAVGNDLLVLPGSILEDCACPEGQFRFPDLPVIHDLEMIQFGDKGELCGDALNKCQYLKIPFTDEAGNVTEKWYTEELQEMYRGFEKRKHYERLFNPNFGIIPTIKARGLNFATASPTAITIDDIKQWKKDLVAAGIMKTEFAVFAGVNSFLQWQDMLMQAGVTQLAYTPFPNGECKWIDMQYCGISVAGLHFHIYEDCTFSNGKGLGGNGSTFPNASIIIPMGERTTNVRGGFDNRMLTTVYFKSLDGRVWDKITDSNGVLGTRNTFGAGCEQQEWTIKTRFVQEIHCPNAWGFSRLP